MTIKQVPQEKLNHMKKKSEPNKEEVQKTAVSIQLIISIMVYIS